MLFLKTNAKLITTSHILELLWISAALLIPIVCVKQYFLVSESDISHAQLPKVALLRTIAAAMLLVGIYQIRSISIDPSPKQITFAILRYIKSSSESWIVVSVSVFVLSTVVTTLLSTNLKVSLIGLIPGQDSYSSYNTVCYLIIFTTIAMNLRTKPQFYRLACTVVGMGVIISIFGIFQHFGVNILGFLPGNPVPDYSRASLTTGNPVTAGSLLLMPISVTFICSLFHIHNAHLELGICQTLILRTLYWVIILSVQISALLFTLSRGPWIATATSAVLFISCLVIFRKLRLAVIFITILSAALLVAVCVNNIPVPYANESSSSKVIERVIDIKTQMTTGGLNQRLTLWTSSADLILHRPWFQAESLPLSQIRHIIGYGPATFAYVFNLNSLPSSYGGMPLEAHHAHNYFIHQAVSQGILGFISSIGLLAAPILMSLYLLIFRRDTNTDRHILLLSGIFALFSGRLADQMVSLAVVSDLSIFWILIAMTVTGIRLFYRNVTLTTTPISPRIIRPCSQNPYRVFSLVSFALIIIIITSIYAIKYPIAGLWAGESRYLYESGDLNKSLSQIDTAIAWAPDVPYYYYYKGLVLREFINRPEISTHEDCNNRSSHVIENEAYHLCLAEALYSTLYTGMQISPFWYHATLEFANVAKQFGQHEDSLRAFQHLASILPTNRAILHLLSKEYIEREMFDQAKITLNRSLTISSNNPLSDNQSLFVNEALNLLELTK